MSAPSRAPARAGLQTRGAAAVAAALLLAAALCGCTARDEEPAAAATAAPAPPAAPAPSATPAASPFHERLLTLDTHVDIPLDFATPAVDPLYGDLQVNLEKMLRGGLDAAFFIVYVGQTARTPENYAAAQRDALTKFDAIRRMAIELYPDRIGLAYTPDDVEALIAEGRLAAAIGIENGYVIGRDLALLDRYYELGARYMTLVHNGHNDIADSAMPRAELGDAESEHDGVSEFGEQVIARMNELGMMVDISHASKATALDAIRLSRAPVIASHSGIRAMGDHPRNLDDETLLALRDNGGVVQIVAFDAYVKVQPEAAAAESELRERYGVSTPADLDALPEAERNEFLRGIRDIQQQWPPADVEDFVDHIDYAVDLIGIDHVGIASDFGGGGGIIGWTDASETPNVTAELQRRGYTDEEIQKIWSGNFLRVWREVERVAAGG
ncbi:MAG TPA: dipeptidase [Gammaproteobacteria bacterium]